MQLGKKISVQHEKVLQNLHAKYWLILWENTFPILLYTTSPQLFVISAQTVRFTNKLSTKLSRKFDYDVYVRSQLGNTSFKPPTT